VTRPEGYHPHVAIVIAIGRDRGDLVGQAMPRERLRFPSRERARRDAAPRQHEMSADVGFKSPHAVER
jgi:hypothetical protein